MSEVNIPENLKYTETHEWVKVDGNVATVGITDFAQQQMTDIVYVELPEVGREISKGDVIATIESVKSAEDVYSPLTGKIVEVNEELSSTPEKINESPYEAWIVKIEISNPDELNSLLDASAYREVVEKESH